MRLGNLRDAYHLLCQAEVLHAKLKTVLTAPDFRLKEIAGSEDGYFDLSAQELGAVDAVRAAMATGLRAQLAGLEARLQALGVEPDEPKGRRKRS